MCNLYRMTRNVDEVALWFDAVDAVGGANFGSEVYPGYPGLVVAEGRVRTMNWGFPLQMKGKAGQTLASNDWLMGIRSRISIPGGTCEFDLPSYYAWQHEPAAKRQQDLQQWVGTLSPFAEAVKLVLGLLRDTGQPHMVAAPCGQYQQNLKDARSYQLLRLRIDPALGLVPEISANRLMVSIRLMRADAEGKLKIASDTDASFELTLCA